jgi:hypothetical protein
VEITDDNSRHITHSHSTGFMNEEPKKEHQPLENFDLQYFFSIHMATFNKCWQKTRMEISLF